MKNILVYSQTNSFKDAVASCLDLGEYRVADIATLPIYTSGVQAVVAELTLNGVAEMRKLQELLTKFQGIPLILYSDEGDLEMEEEAYHLGVSFLFRKPLRSGLLAEALSRLTETVPRPGTQQQEPLVTPGQSNHITTDPTSRSSLEELDLLREFIKFQTHSLDAERMLESFLELLRDRLATNRAAVFLRDDSANSPTPDLIGKAAAGLDSEHIKRKILPRQDGIWAHVLRHGRILRRSTPTCYSDDTIRRDFDALSCSAAVPIIDGSRVLGLLVVDERLTGGEYSDDELTRIFHLLQGLSHALNNSLAHRNVREGHGTLQGVLDKIGCGYIVVYPKREIRDVNDIALKQLLCPQSHIGAAPAFSAIPQYIGSKAFEVIRSGQALDPFKYSPSSQGDIVYRISISPFGEPDDEGYPVVIISEDISSIEHSQKLEFEAANLRLVNSMAEQLAHAIGNSLVPLSTHQQLLNERLDNPDFRNSLSLAMSDTVKRISRFSDQMLYLTREEIIRPIAVPLKDLLYDAFQGAQRLVTTTSSRLDLMEIPQDLCLLGDRKALLHAFTEVILNALQADTENAVVTIQLTSEGTDDSAPYAVIDIIDSGSGFSDDAQVLAEKPFFTTRNIGLGLGLTVCKKVIEAHNGKIHILHNTKSGGYVRLHCPLADPSDGDPIEETEKTTEPLDRPSFVLHSKPQPE